MKRITKTPNSVFLNVTTLCQLNCTYCSSSEDETTKSHMNAEKLFTLLRDFLEQKVFTIILTGGEPLLHPRFHDMIDLLSGRIAITILTNGINIDRNTARYLKGKKVNSVGISLDSAEKDTAEILRGKGSYSAALHAAEHLLQEKVPVHFNAVLTKYNRNGFKDFVNLCSRIGVKSLGITGLKKVGRGEKNYEKLHLDFDEKKAFYHSFRSLRPFAVEKGINISWTEEGWGDLYYSKAGGSGNNAKALMACSAGIDQCAIMVDGSLSPCNYFHNFICGNVFETSLSQVWRHSEYLKQIRELPQITVDTIKECSVCEKNSMCSGGCRASAFTHHNNLLAPDPSCWFVTERELHNMPSMKIIQTRA